MSLGRLADACAAGWLLAALCACRDEPEVAQAPPPEVKVAEVLQRDVPIHLETIGETVGNAEIEIRARVEGFIESVEFQEGTLVEKGQLLYTIDPRPLEAAKAEAQARVAEASAQLARARQDVARYEPLVEKNAISREEYETAVALESAAVASVHAAEALAVGAEVDLSYTKVLAPDAGLVGTSEVDAGTLVGGGMSTLLTRISRIDPIHVRFTFSEKDYLDFARRKSEREQAGAAAPLEMILADGTTHPHGGTLVFVDRAVDPRTGTITAEASFPNPEQIVRPGQYARVRAVIEEQRGAILVPQGAVQERQAVYSVMVLGQGDEIEQRLVTPGRRVGSLWVIESGLQPGDTVVVEGLQRIRPGVQVRAEMVPIEEEATAPPGTEPKPPQKPSQGQPPRGEGSSR